MSETLSSTTIGVTSSFVARNIGSGIISSGSSGTILTLTPPTRQRVRLTHLSTADTVGGSGPVIIAIGGVDITSAIEINGKDPHLGMSIGVYHNYAAGNPPSKNFNIITGGTDESITIRMSSGSTLKTIYYGYIFGL